MKIFIDHIKFCNVAPFGDMELNFVDNEIAVLSAINGKGKTTVLSYITDALYELAKRAFHNTFENVASKFYRVSSPLAHVDYSKNFAVFISFKLANAADTKKISYLELRGDWNEVAILNEFPQFNDDRDFVRTSLRDLKENGYSKRVSSINSQEFSSIFSKNIATYFPAYRYEEPSFLNEPYKIKNTPTVKNSYAGDMVNPIEVITGLKALVTWLLDVALDLSIRPFISIDGESKYVGAYHRSPLKDAEDVLRVCLSTKFNEQFDLGFYIANHRQGVARVGVFGRKTNKLVYPSLYSISSGESALLTLFLELIRQFNNIQNNDACNQIQGIVLIDEVDKHLHIKMQKEVLPKLFQLFPNVQFIVSSHSPFLSMGLAELCSDRSRLINLDQNGLSQSPEQNELYDEVYQLMVTENQRFKRELEALRLAVAEGSLPLVITEGKTDTLHLKNALSKLGKAGGVEFFDVPADWGESCLLRNLKELALHRYGRIVIGVFDRDNQSVLSQHPETFRNWGNNVYSMCIPIVNQDAYETEQISIEHYYPKETLMRLDESGRRLFLAKEFNEDTPNSIDGNYRLKHAVPKYKFSVNGVIDSGVYETDDLEQRISVALSKNAFAEYISSDRNDDNPDLYVAFQNIFDVFEAIITDARTSSGG